jgi:ABC-type arginine transport system permease subunit
MATLSMAYAILVIALSIAVITAVWKNNKEKVNADLIRVAKALHLRH